LIFLVPITSSNTELACNNLKDPPKAASLRADVVRLLKNTKPPTSNITKGERTALDSLKKDKTITILPADKGRATVIMDKSTYSEKMDALLADTDTYEKLPKDPTPKYLAQMVEILRSWQRTEATQIPPNLYRRIYPTKSEPPKLYGQPKIHKQTMPLRPIVSGVGSMTHNAAAVLAEILTPLVGNTIHHIKNSKEFAITVQNLEIPPGNIMMSYDVTALFTSIPVPDALTAVLTKLDHFTNLTSRTPLSKAQILQLLEFCLATTYFVFEDNFYKQKQGTAMGSPVSPIVANLKLNQKYGAGTWTIPSSSSNSTR
jgi:hypothetical protein